MCPTLNVKSQQSIRDWRETKSLPISDATTESTSGGRRCQHESDTNGAFLNRIPECYQIDDACNLLAAPSINSLLDRYVPGKKPASNIPTVSESALPAFSPADPGQHTYEEPEDSDLGEVLHAGKPNGEDAPAKQQSCQPPRWAYVALHDPVRRHFEHGVRDREQRHGNGILDIAHAGLLYQRISRFGVKELAISDISTV